MKIRVLSMSDYLPVLCLAPGRASKAYPDFGVISSRGNDGIAFSFFIFHFSFGLWKGGSVVFCVVTSFVDL